MKPISIPLSSPWSCTGHSNITAAFAPWTGMHKKNSENTIHLQEPIKNNQQTRSVFQKGLWGTKAPSRPLNALSLSSQQLAEDLPQPGKIHFLPRRAARPDSRAEPRPLGRRGSTRGGQGAKGPSCDRATRRHQDQAWGGLVTGLQQRLHSSQVTMICHPPHHLSTFYICVYIYIYGVYLLYMCVCVYI